MTYTHPSLFLEMSRFNKTELRGRLLTVEFVFLEEKSVVRGIPHARTTAVKLLYAMGRCTAVRIRCHARKPDVVFRWNGRVHVTRRWWQLSRLLAAEVCGSTCSICTVIERLCPAVLRGMLDTHSILLLSLNSTPSPSHASPCGMSY
jgi:hypothetical protein